MAKFTVMTGETTAEGTVAIVDMLKRHEFSWWHWLPNGWLVIGDTLSCEQLRDELRLAIPKVYLMVVEVQVVTWEGYGPVNPEDASKDMFDWMLKNWKPYGQP